MPTIKFIKEKQEIECEEGAVLRDVARAHGIDVHQEPMGQAASDITWGLVSVCGMGEPPQSLVNLPTTVVQTVNCRGFGICGTCHVHVKKGMENCSAKTVREKVKFAAATFAVGHEDEVRLSCQTKVMGDIEVETRPAMNLYGERFW